MEKQVVDNNNEKKKKKKKVTTTTNTEKKKIFVIGDSISIHYGPYLEEYLKGFDIVYNRKEDDGTALLNLDQPMGANGGDSSMVLQYLRYKIIHHDNNNNNNDKNDNISSLLKDVDCLLVNCGLHDIKTDITTKKIQIPINQYQQNLIDIIQLVQLSNNLTTTQKTKTKLIWIRTTPLDEQIHNNNNNNNNNKNKNFHRYEHDLIKYNKAADDIMIQNNIPMIDLYQFTNNLRKHGGKLYCDHIHFHTHVREKQGAFLAGWIISNILT